jgi:hypothetical protein
MWTLRDISVWRWMPVGWHSANLARVMLAAGFATVGGGMATAQGQAPSAAGGGRAQPVLLELFTSQGCSSCPAADRLLESYTARSDVIAITLPVDYWDYLGWKDTLANPKFTKRQREYAARHQGGQVYTPQIVVDGRVAVVGSDRARIDRAIRERRAEQGAPVAVNAKIVNGTTLTVTVGAGQIPDGALATVWVAAVQPRVDVKVKSGENRGSHLTYFNVVRDAIPVGKWTGEPTTISLDRSTVIGGEADKCVVFIQSSKMGPVIAASWVE